MDEITLVRRAAAGDREAAATIYERYQPAALARAHALAARDHRDYDLVEDAVQTAFLWLLEGRWKLDHTVAAHVTLHKFISTVTTFAWLSLRRRATADQRFGRIEEPAESAALTVPSPAETPEDVALRRERLRAFVAAVQRLPPQYRRVARLRMGERSGPEIAAHLKLKNRNLSNYFTAIRAKLRPALADFYTLPPEGAYARYYASRGSDAR